MDEARGFRKRLTETSDAACKLGVGWRKLCEDDASVDKSTWSDDGCRSAKGGCIDNAVVKDDGLVGDSRMPGAMLEVRRVSGLG